MIIEERQGDIFEVWGEKFPDLAHGCNAQGVMGAGFALRLKTVAPWAFKQYVKAKPLIPGTVVPSEVALTSSGFLTCYNMITQLYYGEWGRASLKNVEDAVNYLDVIRTPRLETVPVLAPRIGCGLGGLKWEEVRPILEASKSNWIIFTL